MKREMREGMRGIREEGRGGTEGGAKEGSGEDKEGVKYKGEMEEGEGRF